MATLQTSGPITLQDLIDFFGGGSKLTDFYRGGGLVPSVRSTTSQVVNYGNWSGSFYQPFVGASPRYFYNIGGSVYWDDSLISLNGSGTGFIPFFITAPSGFQYQRVTVGSEPNGIRRRSYVSFDQTTDTPINTNVPSSGAIKLTDFYGAVDE